MSLLHLIPDATDDMSDALKGMGKYNLQSFETNKFKGSDTKYPLAMFLVAVGFFIVAIVEIAVNQCHGHGHSHGDNIEGSFGFFFRVIIFVDKLWARIEYDTVFGVPRGAV